MSNIGIFVGREHHFRKLFNVGLELTNRGHNVVPVIANNAINIDPPQMNLGGHHIHVYNYLSKQNVIFINSISKNYKKVVAHTPLFWKYYSIRELLLVYSAFRNFFSSEDKPSAMLILHENNFWAKTISFLCKRYEIPCFSFQEGLLRDKDQERFNKQSFSAEYSTKMFVWGKSSLDKYIKAGIPEDKMIVSGAAHLALLDIPEKAGTLLHTFSPSLNIT